MLAIHPPSPRSSRVPKCTPHLLPCRIHHDGPVNITRRYWDPKTGEDGKPEAYFRGRKLRGREVAVPEGYRGVVVKKADGEEGGKRRDEENEENRKKEEELEEEEEEGIKVLEEVATFEELVVWGHEAVPEADDVFVKGVEEWIRFAEAIHASGDGDGEQRGKMEG